MENILFDFVCYKIRKMFGYAAQHDSRIKSVDFSNGKIHLLLNDGRIISAPLDRFPEIKKLSPSQRRKYHIMGGIGFDFDDSDMVYHLADFLGSDLLSVIESNLVSEPRLKYAVGRKVRRSK